ncbi:hypothetical protein EX895_005185 [Sporisorium graminicola]|uniref:Uncharacterized protein n=1 Tax=Sporisorium graminicola TaxID=280036 RepID=A0A4U7KNY3_9BASI|nr:hypothetical protein EX895_005185 [Sporisorium graminicola]TKY85646.1 hypothetical protein EX895_005185 [Sporisorium graminicola]
MSSVDERPECSRSARRGGQVASKTQGADTSEAEASTPLLQRPAVASQRPTQTTTRPSRSPFPLLAPLVLIALLIGAALHTHLIPRTTRDERATSLLPNATLTNGTHAFRRTVILISLDGAKPSDLDAGLAPSLQALGTASPRSRRARYMQPIFPTLTFPNHWTLLTGLFASSHGVVANDFHDARTGQQFYYTDPARSWEARWPRWFQRYEGGWDLEARLAQVLAWIDVERVEDRPGLVCAYVPDIDQAAHTFGPDSPQALAAVRNVDAFIARLHAHLEQRTLTDIVDLVIVSDHGMTSTSNTKLVYLDDLLGPSLYAKLQHRDGWPSAGLRFHGTPAEQHTLAHHALRRLQGLERTGWTVYTRATLPARYHLRSTAVHDRLAPLWIVPDLGWSITTHKEMAAFSDGVYAPRGNHGYDNAEPEMHAVFVASGPSFGPLAAAEGKRGNSGGARWNMDGFRNVEVHNLVSRILGVREGKRAPTNGTWSFWDAHLRPGL